MNRVVGKALAIVSLLIAAPATAQVGADLNVSPKRVILKPSERTATVFVYNRGSQPASYSIELVDRVMTPDGDIRTLEELAKDPAGAPYAARLKSAKSMLVFTPRRVLLGPNENQTVRVRVLRPADLPAGEYRTTLTVTAIPPEDVGLTAEQAGAQEKGEVAMRVVALFSISVPVIVRHGEGAATARIVNPRIDGKTLTAVIERGGSFSLYGDIEVRRGDAKGEVVGFAKGVGIYAEVESRKLSVPLTAPVVRGEKLYVLFRDDDLKPAAVSASETLIVP